jgi:hypothetical protein
MKKLYIPAFPGDDCRLGMSLRQWYAGLAMQGWLSTFKDDVPSPVNSFAKFCFEIADAMLAYEDEEQLKK